MTTREKAEYVKVWVGQLQDHNPNISRAAVFSQEIADYVLCLIPADDGEAVDFDWLVSIGGFRVGNRVFFDDARIYFYWVNDRWATLYGTRAGGGALADNIQTKGAVRLLFRALGIQPPSNKEESGK